MRFAPAVIALLLAAACADDLAAQTPERPSPDGWATSLSVGRYFGEDFGISSVTFRGSDLDGLGPHVALATAPGTLLDGMFTFESDVGLGGFIPDGSNGLHLNGGLSIFLAGGADGAGAAAGLFLGTGAIVALKPGLALRVDFVSHHVVAGGGVSVYSLELGLARVTPAASPASRSAR